MPMTTGFVLLPKRRDGLLKQMASKPASLGLTAHRPEIKFKFLRASVMHRASSVVHRQLPVTDHVIKKEITANDRYITGIYTQVSLDLHKQVNDLFHRISKARREKKIARVID